MSNEDKHETNYSMTTTRATCISPEHALRAQLDLGWHWILPGPAMFTELSCFKCVTNSLMYAAPASMVEYNSPAPVVIAKIARVTEYFAPAPVTIGKFLPTFLQTVIGASIHAELFSHWRPQVVLVEKAAEVLESLLMELLGPLEWHLIQIGDNFQLPPKVEHHNHVRFSPTGRGYDRYPSVDWTLVETEPWPSSISRVLVSYLSWCHGQPWLDSGSHQAGWFPLPDAVAGAFGLPPIYLHAVRFSMSLEQL